VELQRGLHRSVKGAGALLVSFLLVTVLAVNYVSALSVAKTTWKKTWLVSSSTVTLKTLVSTPSTGTKTWSVSGACALNKTKSAIAVKSTGSCTVTLKIAQKGKYKAAKAVKRFVIRPKGYTGSTVAPATTIASGIGGGSSGGNSGSGTSVSACEGSGSSVIATSVSREPVKAAAAVAVSDATVYYTPAPFTQTLTKSLPGKALTSLAVLCDRAKFLISTSSNAELSNQYFAIDNSFAASTSALTAQTYGSYLRGIFSAVADTADATQFSIESQLHSVYTLDYVPSQGNKLNFAINHAKTTGSPGYVTFTYNKTTKILQAKKRYVLNTTSYTHSLDSSFSAANYYVNVNNGVYSLVASAASATPLYFFNSPIDFDIPTAFNPSAVKLVPNPRVSIASYIAGEDPIVEMEGVLLPNGTRDASRIKLRDLKDVYKTQIATAGVNAATKVAADAMLLTIKSTIEAEGGSLRYDVALYRNFRDQALAGILESASVANGVVGQHVVPYVYFTNEADNAGVHHPFMVMASYNTSDKPNGLNDIRRPPGAMPTATCSKYDCGDVTRDAVQNLVLSKIPMRNYGLVSTVEENSFGSRPSLKTDARYTGASTTYNWASRAANGIAVDGMLIYPAFNNNLAQSQVVGEICVIGAHVGQGMGLHYHADGHAANKNGMHLYNSDDYVGKAHPPLIGFGYDGVALYGVYDEGYSNMVGYNTPLDEYGGHDHDGLGYHYHAHGAVGTTTTGKTYDLHLLLNGAWKGKINSIPNFWPDNTSIGEPEINMGQNNRYVGR
jgi:hypothetical protein